MIAVRLVLVSMLCALRRHLLLHVDNKLRDERTAWPQ